MVQLLSRLTARNFRFTCESDWIACLGSFGTVLGAWVGAFPILLDWNRAWQVSAPGWWCGSQLSVSRCGPFHVLWVLYLETCPAMWVLIFYSKASTTKLSNWIGALTIWNPNGTFPPEYWAQQRVITRWLSQLAKTRRTVIFNHH